MRLRFPVLGPARFLALGLVLAIAAGAPPFGRALAQAGNFPEPPEKLPKQKADQSHDINFLFEALKVAPDDASAKAVEDRIWALWLASGSDTANLLMARVKAAIDAQDLDLAIKLLDAIIELKPDYIEAWNRR